MERQNKRHGVGANKTTTNSNKFPVKSNKGGKSDNQRKRNVSSIKGSLEEKTSSTVASNHSAESIRGVSVSGTWTMLVVVLIGALLAITYPWNFHQPEPGNVGLSADSLSAISPESKTTTESSSKRREAIRVHSHFEVLEMLPHDPKAFTQGLSYDATTATLWEGTGMYGQSELRRVDPDTGEVLASISLHESMFGEGISFFPTRDGERRLIQITWMEKKGWIYNADTLEILSEFTYKTSTGEGWGITYDHKHHEFIVTDGSSYLHFWDADTLQETKVLQVMYGRNDGTMEAVSHLNELEYLKDGTLLCNVWYQNAIIKVNLQTGTVDHVYDFTPLYVDRAEGADCFNGISVTDEPNEFWVTGKWWPHMYRIRFLPER